MHLDNPAWVLNPSKPSLPQGNRTVWCSGEFSRIIWCLLYTDWARHLLGVSAGQLCWYTATRCVFLEVYPLILSLSPSLKPENPYLYGYQSSVSFLREDRVQTLLSLADFCELSHTSLSLKEKRDSLPLNSLRSSSNHAGVRVHAWHSWSKYGASWGD